MNVAVVSRATWAVAQVLKGRGLAGSLVIVGRDARHGSAIFATVTAEVLAAQGFSVLLLPGPVPTPVVAFAVRHTGAAAGIQITASHNPPADNGYKVYFDGGIQIVSPTDREIETAMAAAPFADQIPRKPVEPADADLVERYIERAAGAAAQHRFGAGGPHPAARRRRRGGRRDAAPRRLRRRAHRRAPSSRRTPTSPPSRSRTPRSPAPPTRCSPWPPTCAADVAIALDPDADRCAVGIPTASGWRMLSGDETGWLLGDYILSRTGDPAAAVVASTVVSSRMLAAIAAHYGATHVETLTGFKWLARADSNVPGGTLVYAYEEAIGHCVDPDAVRDKDGISAAVLVCDLVATLKDQGRSVSDMLDELARRYGVHDVAAVSRRVADTDEAAELMQRLRAAPPSRLAGFAATVTDITDALIFTGGDDETSVRVVVRPSGTEPKLKCYLEIRCAATDDLSHARERAGALRAELLATVQSW